MFSYPHPGIDPAYYQSSAQPLRESNRETPEKQPQVDYAQACAPNDTKSAIGETAAPNASAARRLVNAFSKPFTEFVVDALQDHIRSGDIPHPPGPPRPRLKYLKRVVDRQGVVRIYYARGGKPHIRLDAPEGTPAFLDAYEAAQSARAIQWRLAQRPFKPHRSMRDLVDLYQRSRSYARLAPHTQRVYDRVLHRLLHDEGLADCSAASFGRARIQQLVNRHGDAPAAAADLLKKLRILFRCAVDHGWRADDPTRGLVIHRGGESAVRRAI